MKKNVIVIIGSYYQRAEWYFEDNIKPFIKDIKKTSYNRYESENFKIILASLKNPDNLRGLRADKVFLDSDCRFRDYEKFIMPIVKYKHDAINVVM